MVVQGIAFGAHARRLHEQLVLLNPRKSLKSRNAVTRVKEQDDPQGATVMRHPMKELPLVEDYGEGFRSRLIEWGGMIVSYETLMGSLSAPAGRSR
jgi:hypothetical protein